MCVIFSSKCYLSIQQFFCVYSFHSLSVTPVRKAIILKASYKILYGSVCKQGESILRPHGSYNLEKVLNITSHLEKSLSQV